MTHLLVLLTLSFHPTPALAQGNAPQFDIDAMEKRLKNMPNGEMMIQQLEAHRAEFEAANKKAAAEAKKSGIVGPAKPAEQILAMIPVPPKTPAEARSRLGKVMDGHAHPHSADGDTRSDAAQIEILKRTRVEGANAYKTEAMQAMTVDEDQQAVFRDVQPDVRKLGDESSAKTRELTLQLRAAHDELEKEIQKIEDDAHKKEEAVCPEEAAHNANAAQEAACRAIAPERYRRTQEARARYLEKTSARSSEFRKAAVGLLKRGEADRAKVNKAFSDPNLMVVRQMLQGIDATEDGILQALVGANTELTLNGGVADRKD